MLPPSSNRIGIPARNPLRTSLPRLLEAEPSTFDTSFPPSPLLSFRTDPSLSSLRSSHFLFSLSTTIHVHAHPPGNVLYLGIRIRTTSLISFHILNYANARLSNYYSNTDASSTDSPPPFNHHAYPKPRKRTTFLFLLQYRRIFHLFPPRSSTTTHILKYANARLFYSYSNTDASSTDSPLIFHHHAIALFFQFLLQY